jgi:hypothetical protein
MSRLGWAERMLWFCAGFVAYPALVMLNIWAVWAGWW